MANKSNYKTYWAAEPKSEDAVSGTISRIKSYRDKLRQSGLAERMKKSWMAYIGYGPNGDTDSAQITTRGEVGEMLNINVNQYAAMANQTVTLTTSNKPSVKAIASNSDFQSLGQAQFAEALNDYYDRELSVSDREYETVLNMVLLGEGWIVEDWDATSGEKYMVDEQGKTLYTGDVKLHSLSAFDIARELSVSKVEDCSWICWRHKVNKYDLAAKFPDKKDEILACNDSDNVGLSDSTYDYFTFDRSFVSGEDVKDNVWVWELRHLPTPALPKGRLIRFIDDKTVLFDTMEEVPAHTIQQVNPETGVSEDVTVEAQIVDNGYPYEDELFAFSAASERVLGTSYGHTAFFDLLSLQEGVNLSASIMASAINSGGLQNLYVKRGSNVTAAKLTGALNVIEYDNDIPEARDNVSINAAVPAFAGQMVEWMRNRVALNEVVSGNPSAGMPAQGMALLRAQAVEFHSRLQAAYEKLIQRSRTGILKLLQMYADNERVATIAGKSNSWALKEFKKGDIQGFERFVVEPVNPTIKTLAGKMSIAQPLLENGKITDQQYLQLMTTGRLEPVLKFSADNQARIEREKEMLMQGIGLPPFQTNPDGSVVVDPTSGLPQFVNDNGVYIRPLISDTFWDSIPEYTSVLAMPEIRSNMKVVTAVTDLIKYCMQLWQQQPLALTMVLGGQPYPVAPPMGPPPSNGSGPVAPASNGNTPAPVPPGSPDINMPKPPKLKDADGSLESINAQQNAEAENQS